MSTKSDKYVGRKVEENGTDRVGIVLNAWDLPEGVVGLYVDPFGNEWGEWGDATLSDSEHWTIRRDDDGRRVVSEDLGRLIFGD